SPANRLALAQAYVRENSLALAEPLAAQLASEDAQDYNIRMFYARILRDEHKAAQATAQFELATKLQPGNVNAWSELAGYLIITEQYPQALAALDKVKELGTENAGHMFFRATTLDHLNQRKEALEYYQRFLEASRENPD